MPNCSGKKNVGLDDIHHLYLTVLAGLRWAGAHLQWSKTQGMSWTRVLTFQKVLRKNKKLKSFQPEAFKQCSLLEIATLQV